MNLSLLVLAVICGVPLLNCALIIGMTVYTVRTMYRGLALTPATGATHPGAFVQVHKHDEWAREQGFDWIGAFTTALAGVPWFIAAWRHQERPTYFCIYVAGGQIIFDFVTEFSETRALTTGSVRDAQFLPKPPGDYQQSFSGLTVDELLAQHTKAERFLTAEGGIEMRPMQRSFEECLQAAAIRQTGYVQGLSLWPLRAPVWYWLRKRLLHNKSIEELHRARKVLLPRDPAFREFPSPM